MDAATSRPNRSLASSRRTRPSRGLTLFAGGLIAAVLSMAGAGIALLTPAKAASEPADIDDAPTRNVEVTRVAGPSSESDGPFYPFSVVARGVHTLHRLKEEMDRDPVVADHYGTIAVDSFRFERVAAPRLVYVSYRRGDEIYWTRNRVPLYAGENVLTDGTTSIRARCGNRISETPMEPTRDDEPGVVEFDRAIDPSALREWTIEALVISLPVAGPLAPMLLPAEIPAALPVIPQRTRSIPLGFVPAIGRAPDLPPVPVPEPASLMLVGLGLGLGFGAMMWRRRQSSAGSARSDRTFSSVQGSGL